MQRRRGDGWPFLRRSRLIANETRSSIRTIEDHLAVLSAGLSRVERKLDQFIDVQSRANELVERCLQALE
jgi:hypothetical protein